MTPRAPSALPAARRGAGGPFASSPMKFPRGRSERAGARRRLGGLEDSGRVCLARGFLAGGIDVAGIGAV